MAAIIIRAGYNQGATFKLGKRALTIGRDPGNLIQLVDENVSRRHAMISWVDEQHVLKDLNSQNGVELNGVPAHEAVLSLGDRVVIGATELEIAHDQDVRVDGALRRKVVDRQVTAGATQVLKEMSVKESIDRGLTVDLDVASIQQELNRASFLREVDDAVQRGDEAKDCLVLALEGIREMLGPDRSFVVEFDGGGRGAYTAMRFVKGLEAARKRTPLDGTTLGIAFRQARAHLSNQLNKGQAAPDALASALILPISTTNPDRRAFLYLDSFADSEVTWIDDDLSFLDKVTGRLAHLYD
jgi:hypothetical protein